MSIRSLLLNGGKYPLPSLPTYYEGVYASTTLQVQDNVQELIIDNLPSTTDLDVLGITDPVLVFSLANNTDFTGMITGYSNVDYNAQTCSLWICYANDDVDIRFWVCQAQQ
jgi:hypothetical protein